MANEITKTVWVKEQGLRNYSIDRHKGMDGYADYLMVTEYRKEKGRYRISVPLPVAQFLIEALKEAIK